MQWISDQMDEAIPNLPDMRPNQRTDIPGGVTKYTAYAIKALANQELENYQGVADATGAIINSGYFPCIRIFISYSKNLENSAMRTFWNFNIPIMETPQEMLFIIYTPPSAPQAGPPQGQMLPVDGDFLNPVKNISNLC